VDAATANNGSELTMEDTPKSASEQKPDRNTDASLAWAAVEGIQATVRRLGGSLEQAVAVQEALRLTLLNEPSAGEKCLLKAGLAEAVVRKIMEQLRSELEGVI
jgi:hypothetical protein